MTSFDTLFRSEQKVIMSMDNIVDSVFTAPYNVTITALYYDDVAIRTARGWASVQRTKENTRLGTASSSSVMSLTVPVKKGSATINDLARHKKCVHNKKPERGPKMVYMCFGKQCSRRDKTWPRLDNFRQHLTRMHGDEDADLLLKRSMDWYESAAACSDTQSVDVTGSQDEPMFDTPKNLALAPSIPKIQPDYDCKSVDLLDCREWTPKPIGGTQNCTNPEITPARASPLDRDSEDKINLINAAPEAFLAGAADNLIRAMARIISSRALKEAQESHQGINLENDSTQISKLQRHMLQSVLAAALERLSDEHTASDDSEKTRGWFQCDTCPKRTRLRCEMNQPSTENIKNAMNQDSYMQHLRQQHGVPEAGIRTSVCSTRLDMASQSEFWCGFCNHAISLRNDSQAAWDERLDHIDSEHFKKGERGQGWSFPSVSAIFLLNPDGVLDECSGSPGPGREENPKKRKLAAL
ncbi:hypothetical protein N7474_006142 [Penicillium riverlandense]|uniref:uncharacterized protein n=1 Tax=Penicillium riverlandense TaxID=1903569 RepID=UPI0025485725|nr:uncharacterized protein N7474_006142 [Penicillium riverlandense]KAJ5820551.1 hypothetical protein N7474_006142 [Penicillium riverlandense]